MLKRRLVAMLAVVGMAGFAACDTGTDDADFVAEEPVTTIDTVDMPVETVDTAIERVEVDTAIDVDTIDPNRDTIM